MGVSIAKIGGMVLHTTNQIANFDIDYFSEFNINVAGLNLSSFG